MDLSEVLNKLGLDWRMVLFNSFNFVVFFLILKKFVFGKISKAVHERQDRIEKDLIKADELEKVISEANEKADNIIADANTKANSIIQNSQKNAEAQAVELKIKTDEEIERMNQKAKENLNREKELMFEQLKKQTADVAIRATEKILKEELDKEKDRKIINDYLDQLEINK